MSDFAARLTFVNGKTLELDGPADITKETTDAIDAANSFLLGGGGVDGAIHRTGGPSILQECRRIVGEIGALNPGKAVITTGGRLAAKHVIHTVGRLIEEGGRPRRKRLPVAIVSRFKSPRITECDRLLSLRYRPGLSGIQ
jgi:O-acetyl-ADP-ribose deacetylase (regulator of RNase III)